MGSAQRGQACCAHLLVLFVLIVSNSGIVCMRRWMGASFPADDWKIRILVAHQQQLRAQVSAGVGDHTERQHGFVVASPSARRPSRGRQAAHLRRADATAVHRTKVRRTKSSPWRSEATAAATPCRQKMPSSKASFPNQDKSSQVDFFPGCREDLKRNQLFLAETNPFRFLDSARLRKACAHGSFFRTPGDFVAATGTRTLEPHAEADVCE